MLCLCPGNSVCFASMSVSIELLIGLQWEGRRSATDTLESFDHELPNDRLVTGTVIPRPPNLAVGMLENVGLARWCSRPGADLGCFICHGRTRLVKDNHGRVNQLANSSASLFCPVLLLRAPGVEQVGVDSHNGLPRQPAQSVIERLIGWPGAASRTNPPRTTTSSPLTSSDCTPSAGWLGFS